MKKKFWIVLGIDLLIALVVVVAIIFILKSNNEKKADEKVEKSEIVVNFKNYFNSESPKIIYLTSSTDSYSYLQTPILESIIEDYNLDSLIINSDNIEEEEFDKILDYLDLDDDTPNIVVVKDKEVVATKEGFIDGYNLVNFLIDNDVLESGSEYLAEKDLTIVDYDEFNALYNSNNIFSITLGQSTCSHCIATKPVLSYIAEKYGITLNYIDLTELNESEYNSLKNIIKDLGYTKSIGTPLTLIVKDKELVNYIEGEVPISKFVKAFKNAGIINE